MATGKNIKFHRENKGLTLEQLSVLSDVDVGTISALEVRDSSRSKFFSQIATALGMTVAELEIDPAEYKKMKSGKSDDAGAISVAGLKIKSIEQQLLDMYRGMSQAHKEVLEQLANSLYTIDNPRDKVAAGRDTKKKEKNSL